MLKVKTNFEMPVLVSKHEMGDNRLPKTFWDKVVLCEVNGCWLWTGRDNGKGYCTFKLNGNNEYCHRFSYTIFVGPIAEGLEIDHLCRVRRCCNPSHLEAVTPAVNQSRSLLGARANAGMYQKSKTHCPQGHAYTAENTYIWNGFRQCNTCRLALKNKEKLARDLKRVEKDRICPNGHERTADSTYWYKGHRQCKLCRSIHRKRHTAAQKVT